MKKYHESGPSVVMFKSIYLDVMTNNVKKFQKLRIISEKLVSKNKHELTSFIFMTCQDNNNNGL